MDAFSRDLGFTLSRAYQDLCIPKYDHYEGYDYIATHVDYVIIDANNLSKYMHEIEIYFKVKVITDSLNNYLINELVWVGNSIHVSSKKYINEILRKYQKTHGDLKKEVIPIRVKEHPELDDSPLLNAK